MDQMRLLKILSVNIKKNFDSLDDNNNWANYNLIKSYNKLHTLKYFLLIIFPIFFTLKYFFQII